MDIIIVDDKQLMAGTFKRYFKSRFGRAANVSTVSDAESCLKEINDESQVIVLDYMFDGQVSLERGKTIFNTIKMQKPDTEIALFSTDEDVRNDIVKATKQLERRASNFIVRNDNNPLNIAIASTKYAIVHPARIFLEEHSITEFLGLYLITFTLLGIIVLLSLLIIKM